MSDALVNGLAGASGGIIAQLITYPLQAVNTRQQTERKSQRETSHASSQGVRDSQRGTLHAIATVLRNEGWSGLYRGLPPSLLGTAVSQGVYYYFYQLFQDKAKATFLTNQTNGNRQLSTLTNLLVASCAGVMNVLLTNPIWIIVVRMQTQAQVKKPQLDHFVDSTCSPESSNGCQQIEPHSTLTTIVELYREAGILGFWKGVFPTLVMVCNPAIQFAIYEGLVSRLTAKRPEKKGGAKSASALEIFVMGAIAKLGATVATYPLLVVKSRLQAHQAISLDRNSQYSGTLDAILKIIRNEGLGTFYRGMSTKITQSVLAASILFLTKEELVKLSRAILDRKERLRRALLLKSI